ncbi:flagellar biosynthesis protein FliR [Polymorphum gilvum]|uniref:Bacterial export protein, family 1 n=1 Tax=Polymorphum gilvum (strain LMG 25793 / CGMCC 1.9160 / SL003B-26A1) TaxID=991905 RepID=F2J4N2_POLGS|nr:flagellar biosynthesis protein FliR [Polymorphum gilvum]ADZ72284.1 Bacterial export protein, family 1 [Polymorphum gilvum SL003B-26A1]
MTGAGLLLTQFGPQAVLATFLLFCRIGACLMVIPGFSSDRIAVRIRLLVAVAATLALAPLLLPVMSEALPDMSLATTVRFIVAELFVGLLIGLLGRAFMAALETIGTLVAMAIGMSNIPGVAIDGADALPPLASLMTLTATALIFISGHHWEVFRGLAASYETLPPGGAISLRSGLEQFTEQLATTFVLALRIGSPFIVYSVVVNFAIGLTNKLTPQIPVYFIAMPFVIAGGLYFLFVAVVEAMTVFLDGYVTWLKFG